MSKLKVEIEWDKPEDEGWMNIYNLKIALEQVCKNTKFSITELSSGKKVTFDNKTEWMASQVSNEE